MAEITVVLTFDDGPHSRADLAQNYTAQALQSLRTNRVQPNAKAVFFVQTHVPHRGGSRVGKEMIRNMGAEGHIVGIHTGSAEDHVSHIARRDRGELRNDLERAMRYLRDLGIQSLYVRPVGGQTNDPVRNTYRALGLKMLLWDIDSRDSHSGYTRDRITQHLRQRIRDLANAGNREVIVLFHELDRDTRGNIEHYMANLRSSLQEAGHGIRFPTTRSDLLPVLQRRSAS